MASELLRAVESNDHGSIRRLVLEEGLEVNESHEVEGLLRNRYTALEYAIATATSYSSERSETIDILLEVGADPLEGAPILESYVIEYTDKLITVGADIDARDPSFEDGSPTSLTLSARRFDLDMARYLLGSFADPDQVNSAGSTIPLQMVYRLFSDEYGGPSKEEPTAKMLDLFFSYGSSPDAIGPWGEELLVSYFKSAQARNFDARMVSDSIIDAGANVSGKDRRERPITSICMWASVFRREPYLTISKLFSNGAEFSLNEYDLEGKTTVFYFLDGARQNFYLIKPGEQSLLQLLLIRGSDYNHVSNIGDTPLLYVVKRACPRKDTIYQYPVPTKGDGGREVYVDVVEMLLEAGADPEHQDLDGNNSISIAKTGVNCDDIYRLVRKNKYKKQLLTEAANYDTGRDPKANQLRPTAQRLYDEANAAYNNIEGAKQKYIKINEGRRSTSQQARYYESYIRHKDFGGPKAPQAAQPGQSRHEYGLAMDIYRLLDEERYYQALSQNGWERTVMPKEPWHYAATAAEDWDEVQKSKADLKKLSNEFERHLRSYLTFEGAEITQRGKLKDKRKEVQTAEEGAAKQKKEVLSAQRELKRWQKERRDKERSLEDLRQRRSAAEDRYNSMSYTGCPNGFPYEECDHTDQKNAYVERRRELAKLVQRLRADEARTEREVSQLKRRERLARRNLAEEQRELRSAEKEARDARREERKATEELRRIIADKNRAYTDKRATLRNIEAITSGQ